MRKVFLVAMFTVVVSGATYADGSAIADLNSNVPLSAGSVSFETPKAARSENWKESVSIKVVRGNPDSPKVKAFILENGPAFSVRGIVGEPMKVAQIRVLNTTFEGNILVTSGGLLFLANDGREDHRYEIKRESNGAYVITGYVPNGACFSPREDLKVNLTINNQGYTLKNAKIELAASSNSIKGWVYKDNATNSPKFLAMLTAISEMVYALN
ncbi:MAG: hypothetical protein L6420_07375 [Elusimicrobia bacterium]|nr:hypothetical protein [Elusimicrobiota bacterium]